MIYNKKRVALISAILGLVLSTILLYFFWNGITINGSYITGATEFLIYNAIFFILTLSVMLIAIHTLEYFKIMTRHNPKTEASNYIKHDDLLESSQGALKTEPNISAVAESNVSAEDPSEFLNNENNRNHAKVGIPTSSYINELNPEVLFHNETSQGASAPSSSTVAPDWFDGTIPEEGVVIFSGDNKSKITLNPIETALYQLAERCSTLLADLLKSVDKGEADKTILQAPMYLDLKSQLIQAKLWLKENKIEFLENL